VIPNFIGLVSNRKEYKQIKQIFLHFLLGVEFILLLKKIDLGFLIMGFLSFFFYFFSFLFPPFVCREAMHGNLLEGVCYEMKGVNQHPPAHPSSIGCQL
jgi:hypothetical protein